MTPGWAVVFFIVCMVTGLYGAAVLIFSDWGQDEDAND